MAYFVMIGRIPTNKSGVGCRGYHAYRRGCVVRTIWGPIEVRRGREVKFAWTQSTEYKDFRCSSVKAAKSRLAAIVQAREREGYSNLGVGNRIHRPSYAPLGHRRR
jgi:hypothetical protein